ncbi:MAG: small nuclear ribonucleoprotein 35kDa [Benjaminiella poitrasii]|nr:MAG: small nuclear ribonucleoprotein 35kDa [Benjaminiella poitrasii]
MWYSKEYDPIQTGSIDGTAVKPHDAAVKRAILSNYRTPKHLKSDPNCTLFIGRLNFNTIESTLKKQFEKYGAIADTAIIRNNVTGMSQGYGFVTFTSERATRDAYRDANKTTIDGHVILVDYERSRVMKGWVPRRLGGGYGGRKESGQLRFGARDRPFREPASSLHVPHDQKRSDNWSYHSNTSKEASNSRSPERRSRYSHHEYIHRRRRHHSSRSPSPHDDVDRMRKRQRYSSGSSNRSLSSDKHRTKENRHKHHRH